jgi:5-methylcytosine-specific restriction endonuclease McrA
MPRGSKHWNYKSGSYTYETIRKEIKERYKKCSRCGVDLLEAGHYMWVIHHRDHNHFNNNENNLELLCKRCHQKEHKCWEALGNFLEKPLSKYIELQQKEGI